MFVKYGHNRINSGENTLPIMAWKLNNRLPISEDEILVKVQKIHIERNSLKQISSSVGNDEEKIKTQIMGIVRDRGKLHNPFTTTGGTLYGTIASVGEKCSKDVKVGENIIVTTSATMIPLSLTKITSIDLVYGIIEAEGYFILYDSCNFVRVKDEEAIGPMLLGFEESPAIFHAYELSKGQKNILITGNNLIVALIYAIAVRKANESDCKITGVLYPDADVPIDHGELKSFFQMYFEDIHIIESKDVLEYGDALIGEREKTFDFCINCSDASGSEIIDVLALKDHGCLFYTNVMNTMQPALFFSEGICKDIDIVGPVGYVDGYAEFTAKFIEEVSPIIVEFSEQLRRLEKRSTEIYIQQQQELEKKKLIDFSNVYDFVYMSDQMSDVLKTVVNTAKYDCSVLITGETGTGKEKVAKLIHSLSERKLEPCVCLNCGAIPENLMEMEFFGYEKGSFTGANQTGKKGYFEIASNGILFLDEIGEMDLILQAKLLRVLQEKEFYRIGGTTPIHTNARIIASTNRDLREMVENGTFREDLYYRLKVATIDVPALRDRKEDVVPITDYFIKEYNKKYDMDKSLSSGAFDILMEYDWPGNVRELENTIHRLLINSEADTITEIDVLEELRVDERPKATVALSLKPEKMLTGRDPYPEQSFDDYISQCEKEFLKYHLEKYGTTRKTAEMLGLTQSTIMRKKKKYGL